MVAPVLTLQLCADTRSKSKEMPGVADDRDGWRESVMKIHAFDDDEESLKP